MKKQTKWGIALGSIYVIGATSATVAVVVAHHHEHKAINDRINQPIVKINKPIIKTELKEEDATKLYDELIKLGASYGRANLLINEVNVGHITKAQLEQIIKEWND